MDGSAAVAAMADNVRKYEDVQEKTFTRWMNTKLAERRLMVTDLFMDFRSGKRHCKQKYVHLIRSKFSSC